MKPSITVIRGLRGRIGTRAWRIRMGHALAGALAALFFLQCTEHATEVAQGGGGSEAVALVGSFEYPDHNPAAMVRVRLRPKLFLSDTGSETTALSAGTILNAVTDANGAFRMDSVKRGEYFLEIIDSASRGLLIPCTLTGDTSQVELGKSSLQPTGTVTGSIVPPEGFAGRTYVQVYGLDRQVKADSATGSFRMEGIPAGTYTLRAIYSAPAVDPREIASVEVAADPLDTTDIGAVRLAAFENENYSAWPHARRLYLNTTATGANVAANVDDFPVLVRLNRDNFDFSQSRGADIRFADAKGKRLRYEVERWDSAGAMADIWVRVDRVTGNSNTQFLTLHWGLAGAGPVADSRQVFGADAGFAGVWHLNEDAADTVTADLYKDAVGYDPAADRIAATGRSGVIAAGAAFAGNDYITVPVANPLLQPNERLTSSAWVRATRTSSLGGNILSMGDSYNLRLTPAGGCLFTIFNGETVQLETPKGIDLLDSAWHHLAGTYDGANLALYVDGKLSARMAARGSLDYRFWPGFVIGRHGNRKAGYDFHGGIDQVEVSGETARTAEWIRLAYENQRSDAKWVEFRP